MFLTHCKHRRLGNLALTSALFLVLPTLQHLAASPQGLRTLHEGARQRTVKTSMVCLCFCPAGPFRAAPLAMSGPACRLPATMSRSRFSVSCALTTGGVRIAIARTLVNMGASRRV